MTDKLFKEGKINQLPLKNRIIMSAMQLGYDSDRQADFYRSRARGGAAALVAVGGVNEAGAMANQLVLNEKAIPELRKMGKAVHPYGAAIIYQLFHAGRNGRKGMMKNPDKDPLAPSAVPSPIYRGDPVVMTLEDIQSTIDDFAEAARVCREASIDGVEISCSAGYLLTQFFSPRTNKREDKYGGSEENRMRFAREVIQAVRKAVGPDYPVILRISASDMLGGYDVNFMRRFCISLEQGLIDALSVTGGWHESPVPQISAHLPEGGFAYLAGIFRRDLDIPVIACNRINNGNTAASVLNKGLADFVGCARPFLTDPDFANKVREGHPHRTCIACNKGCIERVLSLQDARCIFNPYSCVEPMKEMEKGRERRILVAGGGPAGMEAARLLALKGNRVTLCSDDSHLGGLLLAGTAPPHKHYIGENVEVMHREVVHAGVEIRLGTEVDASFVDNFKPDAVVVATGSKPIVPAIEGFHQSNVHLAEDVLRGSRETIGNLLRGRIFIVGGGSVGLETAQFLTRQAYLDENTLHFIHGNVDGAMRDNLFCPPDITVVEMLSKAGRDLGGTRWITLKDCKNMGIAILTNTKVGALEGNRLMLETGEKTVEEKVDHVILAMGYKPHGPGLTRHLEEKDIPYHVIGDAVDVKGNIAGALMSAHEAADTI